MSWASAASATPQDTESAIAAIDSLSDRGSSAAAIELARNQLRRLEHGRFLDSLAVARTIDALLRAVDSAAKPNEPATLLLAHRAVDLKRGCVASNDPELATSLVRLGAVEGAVDSFTAAERSFQEALRIRRDALGNDHLAVAEVLLGLALLRRESNRAAEGKALYDSAFAIWDRGTQAGVPLVGQSMRSISDYLWSEDDHFDDARRINEQVIRLSGRIFAPENGPVRQSLAGAAWIMQGKGDWDRAWPFIEASLGALEHRLGDGTVQVALALQGVGVLVVGVQDQTELGLKFLDRSVMTWKRVVGEDHPDYARILRHRGGFLLDHDRVADAHRDLDQGYKILARRYGERDPRALLALANVAYANLKLGRHDRALQQIHDCIHEFERRTGDGERVPSVVLSRLAEIEQGTGRLDLAEAAATRNIALIQRRYGRMDYSVSAALRRRGEIRTQRGDVSGSYEDLTLALEVNRKYQGDSNIEAATTENAIGMLLRDSGRPREALAHFERAVGYLRQSAYSSRRDLSAGIANIAGCESGIGHARAARESTLAAARILESVPDADPMDRAWLEFDLSGEESALGYLPRALEAIDRGIGAARGTGSAQSLALAGFHLRRANILVELGRTAESEAELDTLAAWPGALATGRISDRIDYWTARSDCAYLHEAWDSTVVQASRAEAMRRDYLWLAGSTLPDRDAWILNQRVTTRVGSLIAVALHTRKPEHVLAAYNAVIGSRGLLYEQAARRIRRTSQIGSPEVEARKAEVARASQRYFQALYRGTGRPGAHGTETRSARDELADAERALARTGYGSLSEVELRAMSAMDVAAQLAPDEAIVSYVRTEIRERDRRRRSVYVAFVIRAGGREALLIDLGAADSMETAIGKWRVACQAPLEKRRQPARIREREYAGAAQVLRRAAWDPVAPMLGDARHVWIVSDGSLHGVNWYALMTDEGSYFVDQEREFAGLTTERDLASAPKGGSNAGGLLAVGGADFESAQAPGVPGVPSTRTLYRGALPECDVVSGSRFRLLPASALEVEAIGAEWARSSASSRLEVLKGARASEQAFRSLAPGSSVIHLATHTYFVPERCIDSSGTGETSTGRLALSGLALAGANRRFTAPDAATDGILTAEEVSSLDLTGVDLVVLSACETGRGETAAMESVLGLQLAFRVSGARALVQSDWPVEDASARNWMTNFYRARFSERRSTPVAVRLATQELLQERRRLRLDPHPFYWALFTSIGRDL
jgi:CHAT domain-containing protein/tetratricopeptide (TPR) repeat protein